MKHSIFTRRNRYTIILLSALVCLLLLGTGGYMFLEGVEPLRALYMTVVALTTSPKEETTPLYSSDWLYGELEEQSHASPWFAFTIKHSRIAAPQGSLTENATDRIAEAAARNFGLDP